MKYLIGAICAIVFSLTLSFDDKKCEHVYVSVEQAEIKIEQPDLFMGGMYYQSYSRPSGKQEGQDLVCVKCFHQRKQVLDYGKPEQGQTLTGLLSGRDSCLFLNSGTLTIDAGELKRK